MGSEMCIRDSYGSMANDKVPKMQATLDAAFEVAAPIFISTLTTVIVFLPVIFLTGVAKLLFQPLVITITVALFASFFVSRTVTPLFCFNIMHAEKEADPNSKKWADRLKIWAINLLNAIDNRYQLGLMYSLKHRRIIIFGILGVAAVSLLLFKFIGTEFFPDTDEGQFTVQIRLPIGTRIEETLTFIQRVEGIIRKNVPEAQTVIADIGVPNAKSSSGGGIGGNSG